jgi:hypothetical protein
MTGSHKYPDDERLEQEEGVLVPAEGGHRVGCEEDEEPCAPDDTVEDPINDLGVPGTPDDLPYDFGVEVPPAADQQLELIEDLPRGDEDVDLAIADEDVGRTGAPADGDGPPLGRPEERELWNKQRALIEEDEEDGRRLDGIPESDIPDLEHAMGDDAADPLPDAPGGTSATGSVTDE